MQVLSALNEIKDDLRTNKEDNRQRFDELGMAVGGLHDRVSGLEDRMSSVETRIADSQLPFSQTVFSPMRAVPSPPAQTEVKSDAADFVSSLSKRVDENTKDGVYVAARAKSPQIKLEDSKSKRGRSPYRDPFVSDLNMALQRSIASRERVPSPRRRQRSLRRDSSSPTRRHRSISPQVPRMNAFTGNASGLNFKFFLKRFEQIAQRRGWDNHKKLYKFYDCLSEQALEYALSSSVSGDYEQLVADMAVRFNFREEPMAARQRLAVIKQEAETEEEFLQKIQSLVNVGFPEQADSQLVNQMATEAFLRGLKNKEASLDALGRRPQNIQEALSLVRSFVTNSKVLGVGKQVTFQQKVVGVSDSKISDALDKLIEGIGRIEKRLEQGSRSSSPFNGSSQSQYKERDRRARSPVPRSFYNRDGRPSSPARRDYGNNYRDQERSDRYRSPNRNYPSSGTYYRDSRGNSPYRSPVREDTRYYSPHRYRRENSPRDRGDPKLRDYRDERGTGQSRRYDRQAMPISASREDLNSSELTVHATRD
jgi:hypothetical protein